MSVAVGCPLCCFCSRHATVKTCSKQPFSAVLQLHLNAGEEDWADGARTPAHAVQPAMGSDSAEVNTAEMNPPDTVPHQKDLLDSVPHQKNPLDSVPRHNTPKGTNRFGAHYRMEDWQSNNLRRDCPSLTTRVPNLQTNDHLPLPGKHSLAQTAMLHAYIMRNHVSMLPEGLYPTYIIGTTCTYILCMMCTAFAEDIPCRPTQR